MKKFYFPLLLLSFISFFFSCEPSNPEEPEPEAEDIIEIPDEHFKNALVNTNSIDTNGDGVGDSDIDLNNDGEIQRSEANLIKGLNMNFNYLEINNLVEFTGIENFINLKYLKITGMGYAPGGAIEDSDLISYDLTGLKKLEYLEFNNIVTNFAKTLDLSGLTFLKEVSLINNRPHYETYDDENIKLPINFMDVNLEGTVSLTSMDITNSFLNIDLCQVPSLKKLNMFYLEGGEPEVFDFHCLKNLEWLDIGENHIKSLILKNNSVLNIFLASDIGDGYQGANYPHIKYICIDDIPKEFEQIAHLRNEDTVVVTDCEF